MRPFTVLLLVPDTLTGAFGQDTYLTHVEAVDSSFAECRARSAAMTEYNAWDDGIEPTAFHVLFVGHGHQFNLAGE